MGACILAGSGNDVAVSQVMIAMLLAFSFANTVSTDLQAALLFEEAAAAAGKSGQALEASSVLAPLLSGDTLTHAMHALVTSSTSWCS